MPSDNSHSHDTSGNALSNPPSPGGGLLLGTLLITLLITLLETLLITLLTMPLATLLI